VRHEQGVDLLLGHGSTARELGGVDDLDVRVQPGQQSLWREVVGDDDVGVRQCVHPAHRDQLRVAGAAAHQHDAAARRAWPPGGPAAVARVLARARAEDVDVVGFLGDGFVHRRVVGGGDRVPGACQVTGFVLPP
jgi:hypothetical protein